MTAASDTRTSLPKIVRFVGMTDGGPTEGGRGSATCPHCGADGRYTYWFVTEDGERHGAMSGCLKLFPVSPLAKAHRDLIKKEDDLRRKYGPDAHLNKFETAMLAAIEEVYDGTMDERDALAKVAQIKLDQRLWREKKNGRRGY